MINREELDICRRRGHSRLPGLGWSPCESCGMWRREQRTIEEREDEPPQSEMDTYTLGPQRRIAPNAGELLICRRRGHRRATSRGWSLCDWCGYWVREQVTVEEREDEPPEDEMAPETHSDRILDQMRRQLDESGGGHRR